MDLWFGKYKGEDIEDVPSDYLKWLAENFDNEEVALAAEDEYNFREVNNKHFWSDE
jgi:hypothetical protein